MSALNLDIIYIILNLILLFTFWYAGKNISKGNDYWKNAILCVLAFTLVLGLRYGRGNDYHHYVYIYVYGYTEGTQRVFVWLNGLLKWMGVGKYYIFLFYSFIEIVCAMVFLKRYKQYAQYLFPLFLIANIFFDEYQIRQALGFSFVFLCLDRLFRIRNPKDIITTQSLLNVALAVLYFTIAYSIHSACGYMLVIMIVVFVFYQKTIPLKYSIPALLFSAYFFSHWFDFNWLNPILDQFAGEDTRMNTYIENREQWFSEEGMKSKYERKPIILVAEILGTISLYILGSKAINKYVKRADAYAMYNFFVLGSIMQNAFRQLELLNRIGGDFALFFFFPLSIILYYSIPKPKLRYNKQTQTISVILRKSFLKNVWFKLMAVFLLWYTYDILKYLFKRGDMTQFIWDIL